MTCLLLGAGLHPGSEDYYPFTVFQPNGKRTTIGVPPILKEKNVHCTDCGQIHDIELCPICGSFIFIGYGFTGGGLGEYFICDGDPPCSWVYKVLEPIE